MIWDSRPAGSRLAGQSKVTSGLLIWRQSRSGPKASATIGNPPGAVTRRVFLCRALPRPTASPPLPSVVGSVAPATRLCSSDHLPPSTAHHSIQILVQQFDGLFIRVFHVTSLSSVPPMHHCIGDWDYDDPQRPALFPREQAELSYLTTRYFFAALCLGGSSGAGFRGSVLDEGGRQLRRPRTRCARSPPLSATITYEYHHRQNPDLASRKLVLSRTPSRFIPPVAESSSASIISSLFKISVFMSLRPLMFRCTIASARTGQWPIKNGRAVPWGTGRRLPQSIYPARSVPIGA